MKINLQKEVVNRQRILVQSMSFDDTTNALSLTGGDVDLSSLAGGGSERQWELYNCFCKCITNRSVLNQNVRSLNFVGSDVNW